MSATESGLDLRRPAMPASIQTRLEIGETRFRPLGDTITAMRDLDMNAEEVRSLVQLGYLIGFDIACGGAHGVTRPTKMELRILTRSVEQFRLLRRKRVCEMEWPQIFRLIVPHQKPVVTGLEVQRGLNCDRGHVENLVLAGHLTALKKSAPGPGGTWTICRASYENFLKERMQ
jgi:hypothetical protein